MTQEVETNKSDAVDAPVVPAPKKSTSAPKRRGRPPAPKKRGRPAGSKNKAKATSAPAPRRQRTNLDFEAARDFIQEQQIGSMQQFKDWHRLNKPKQIPLYPDRAYQKDWKGWNDFLGNENEWAPKQLRKRARPYLEAAKWAQTLQLKTHGDWLEYCRVVGDELPEDIPRRPDVYYKEWMGWGAWLGNSAVNKVVVQQKIVEERVVLFYIASTREVVGPANVFEIGVASGGITEIREEALAGRKKFHALFWRDKEHEERVNAIVDYMTTPWHGDPKHKVVPNFHDLCWAIGEWYERAKF